MVTILGAGAPRTVQAETDRTLLDVLREQGLAPDAPCGGRGTCGNCRVQVTGAVSEPTGAEAAAVARGERLACQCRVAGDCTVTLRSREAAICTAGTGRAFSVTPRAGLGAAVDIGTTTVVLYLYDLATGAQIAAQSAMNAQRPYGADVISRISWCNEHPDGLETLTAAVRGQIVGLLCAACAEAGRGLGEVAHVSVAGNTVMQHLYAGLSPSTIAVAPFTPLSLFGEEMDGAPLGLPGARVYLAPCVAGYVGGDITAGLLSSGASCDDGPSLFLDVGTNGEMAIVHNGRIVSCATAAGPAFEGAEIACGMSARAGAVDSVSVKDGEVTYTVLGGGAPEGLCGSGLVDALAVMLQLGAVDETGRLLPPDEAPETALPYLGECADGVCFVLAPGVYVSAADVRKLQLAKAAVAAGIEALLQTLGLRVEELKRLYLAGGFGNYLRPESAARIGIYPAVLTERLIACGNSAGAGAAAALCSDTARAELAELAARAEYLELSGSQVFSDAYIEAMEFPEE